MPFLNTKHKKKSAVITVILLLLLIFGIYNFGMRYLDPPEEYGLSINLGNTNVGSGEPIRNSKQKTIPKKSEEKIKTEIKETLIKEKAITKETTKDVPIIEKVKEKKKEIQPKKEIVKKKKKPTPSKATQKALKNLFNGNTTKGKPKGEGDDKKPGIKGKKEGDINSKKYYGNKGNGNGGNYNLAGRQALSKPIEKPDCQEEGIVVVSVEVDKKGKVIKAIAGIKGTTNTSPCLLKPAKSAALKTIWNSDKNAPFKQKGTIIYQFTLSQ